MRRECPDCGRTVAVRVDGSLRVHQTTDKERCISSAEIADREREAARLAKAEADCRAIGIGHLWDALPGDTAYEVMVREILSSVASYFVETAAEDVAA